jgi:histidyl-tRNA synthetase
VQDERDQEIVRDAPELIHSLTPQSRARMESINQGLTALGHNYTLNTRLVRGLDYYSELCFEIKWLADSSELTVLAGGRYDGLAQQLGHNAPLPAVGWAAGIERLALLLTGALPAPPRSVALIQVPGADAVLAAQMAAQLRAQGVIVDAAWDWRGDVSKQLRYAVKRGASVAVFVGPEELARGVVAVKDLTSSEQREVTVQDLVTYLHSLSAQQIK